jgi:hypothetical protein
MLARSMPTFVSTFLLVATWLIRWLIAGLLAVVGGVGVEQTSKNRYLGRFMIVIN